MGEGPGKKKSSVTKKGTFIRRRGPKITRRGKGPFTKHGNLKGRPRGALAKETVKRGREKKADCFEEAVFVTWTKGGGTRAH